MPKKIELTYEEHAAVKTLLNRTVSESRFPFSDRIRILRAALAKLEPRSVAKPRKAAPPLPSGPMVGSRRKPRRSALPKG
jgi:hypothetical protein